MIDYFFRWNSITDAKADALWLTQKYAFEISPGVIEWARDKVLPNIKAWRPSQDVGGVHTYLIGWFAIVALNGQVPILLNASALAFALDRNGSPYVIKNNIGTIITDVACEPIFAGSHYPLGGYT